MRTLLTGLVILAAAAIGLFFYVAETEGDGDMCVAKAELVAAQIPPALDILSARHPGSVGLIRSLFNKNGGLDAMIVDIVSASIQDEDLDEEKSQIECAWEYADIYFHRERVRNEIADAIEEELGLERN